MSSLSRTRRSAGYNCQSLKPSLFAPKSKLPERSAPWLARAIKWVIAIMPGQNSRALWLSKPAEWFKKLYSLIRQMTPKQLSRTMWLTKLSYKFNKIIPSRKNITFSNIKEAMDNSHFRHFSNHEELSKMCHS